MKHIHLIKTIALLLLVSNIKAYAQNFNYTISVDSSATYTPLSDASILSSTEKWLPQYEINTGFSPGSLQSVVIETNGFIVFNKQYNSAVMAFYGFGSKIDSSGNRSRLSYTTSGTEGSKILKIEYKNVGMSSDPHELTSFQVWIKENGSFDVVVGSNSYEPNPGDTLIDTNRVVHIGLINRNMDTTERGIFISGTPGAPQSVPLNDEHPDLSFLRTVPKRGFKYTFTPNQN